MATAGKLDQGRESFRQQAWAGAYALLSSADQVPRSVGEGFGQVSAQFRELELEELGQTPPRLVEHVVARLSDSGAVTGEFMSKAVRALGLRRVFRPRSRSRRTSGRTTQQAPRSGPSLPSTPRRRAAPTSPTAVTRTGSRTPCTGCEWRPGDYAAACGYSGRYSTGSGPTS